MNGKPIEAMLHIGGKLRVQDLEKDDPKEDLEQMVWDEVNKEIVPANKRVTRFIYPKTFLTSEGNRSEVISYNNTSYTRTDGHLFISNVNIIPYAGYGNHGVVNNNPNDWTGIRNIKIYGQEEHHPTWKVSNIATFFAYAVRPAPNTNANWTIIGTIPSGSEAVVAKGTHHPHFYTNSKSATWEFDTIGIAKDFVYIKKWYDTPYNNNNVPSNQEIAYEVTADENGNASLPENPLANLPY